MKDQIHYELSPAQDVPYLQCKYSLFKRVINILPSLTFSEDIDADLMTRAFNLIVERNDCLRIKFFKRGLKLMQYFDTKREPVSKIPSFSFNTEQEQTSFIVKLRRKPIKYLRGQVIEPYLIKTYDKKTMLLFKVCHLAVDIYGLNIIFNDLLGIYNALKNGTELPPSPDSFERIVKKDIEKKGSKEAQKKHEEFFMSTLGEKEEPYYAGIHGPNNKIWKKQLSRGHRGMKLLFVQNETQDYRHKIDGEAVSRAIELCKENQYSLANLLLFVATLTASRLNGDVENLMPLELYNCRVSREEKASAGTKVQSLGCHVHLDFDKSFEENMSVFVSNQFKYCRHVSFEDRKFETLTHKVWKSSLLDMYYFMSYSFLAFEMPEGVDFNIHSNGRGALPAYIVQLLNPKTNEITMAYDVQTRIISESDVARYHEMYLRVLSQVIDNPQIKLSDVEI